MQISVFIGGLSGGGAERVACNLANYLSSKGNSVRIITMSEEIPAYYLDECITIQSLLYKKERGSTLYNWILRIKRLRKALNIQKDGCFIVMLPYTIALLLSLRKLTKAKVIAAERCMPNSYSKRKQNLLLKTCKNADGWIFQTPEIKKFYENKLKGKKTIVIPNAINPEFLENKECKNTNKEIITAGRMTEQKNHILLIQAFSKIALDFPNYHLTILGEGPKRKEIEQLISELGLEGNISLPGYVNDVQNRINNASMFVLSSDYEGMPNALMEAMAMGVPSISTDCDGGGARFLIENGKNGLLVPKNDVDALAAAMRDLLSHPEKAERLGEEGRKLCERLAPEKIYGEWEEFIKDVVNN